MNIHVNRPRMAADSIPVQLAAQQRRAEKTRQRVCKLREKASAEIERLIAFLDASDGYSIEEREEAVDDVACDDLELEIDDSDDEPSLGYDEPEGDYVSNRSGHVLTTDDEDSLGWTTDGRTHGLDGDREDEHDGSEPDEADLEPSIGYDCCTIIAEDDRADDEPSLGWTENGRCDGPFDDREAGIGPRLPQNRTDLKTKLTVHCSHRRFVHGLTDSQRKTFRERMNWPDSGVSLA